MSEANNSQLEELDGERGLPSVNEEGRSKAGRGLIFIGLVLIVILGAGAGFWKFQQKKQQVEEDKPEQEITVSSAIPNRTFDTPPPLPGELDNTTEITNVEPVAAPIAPVYQPPLPVDSAISATPKLNKSSSALMVSTSSSDSLQGVQSANLTSMSSLPGDGSLEEDGPNSNPFNSLLSSTQTSKSGARHLGNRNYIIAKGAFIGCGLNTRLDSTVAGMVGCTVTRNIYSDNGKVLLIERGSIVTGEYRSNVRQGMRRIFVLWTRVKTPHGVIVDLNSPGADPLGGSGIPGYVDNHFWQRFGGAILLSVIDDLSAHAAQQNDGDSDQINFNSTGDAAQEMAVTALENTINIPPTLYKNHGDKVGIYIARDLDFSGVYNVR